MAVLSSVIGRGTLAARPAAGNAGRLYFATDGSGTMYRDNGSSWDSVETSASGMTNPMTTQGDIIYGGASGSPTRLGIGTAGQVLKVNAGATAPEWGPAGGGAPTSAEYVMTASDGTLSAEVVIPGFAGHPDKVPSSPHAQDAEFDDTDTTPASWLLQGSPTVDSDTTRKSALYLVSSSNAAGWEGVYLAVGDLGTLPKTLTICVSGVKSTGNYQKCGIFIAASATGSHEAIQVGHPGWLWGLKAESYTSNTSGGSDIGTVGALYGRPVIYLRCVVNSTTSIDWAYSYDNQFFANIQTARNPGFTIARIGIGVKTESISDLAALLVDWARIS